MFTHIQILVYYPKDFQIFFLNQQILNTYYIEFINQSNNL